MKPFINSLDRDIRVAVISDTHDLLRPSVLEYLNGIDLIIHAGDVGSLEMLKQIQGIAEVCAVRGNIDYWADNTILPLSNGIVVGGLFIYLIHNLDHLDISLLDAEVDIVVSGHTHQPHEYEQDGVLFLNPGSIGPRRYDYPISLLLLTINNRSHTLEQIVLVD